MRRPDNAHAGFYLQLQSQSPRPELLHEAPVDHSSHTFDSTTDRLEPEPVALQAARRSTAVNPAIECTDSAGGYDVQDFIANAAISRPLAPTFGTALPAGAPAGDGSNGAACAQWPVKNPPSSYRGDYRAQGAAPILVVGTTNDPSTPYEGAVTLSQTLDRAQLLTFVGEGHTAYVKSACIGAKVATYLTSRVLPAVGTGDRCVESPPPARFAVPKR
jgi:hypothetical protein